jgi:hypothetical protein
MTIGTEERKEFQANSSKVNILRRERKERKSLEIQSSTV